MAGISWPEGASGGTNLQDSNGTNASSGAALDSQRSPFALTYGAVLGLGLLGNAVALALLPCRAKPLSHSYIFLLQLAPLDALLLCLLPLHIHAQLRGAAWPFGAAACRLTAALLHLRVPLAVAFLGCLCAHLWLAALHPLASVRLRAAHCALLAAALWLLALGAAVPPTLRGEGPRSSAACFGSFPASWAAPHAIPAFVFGVLVPFAVILLGFPLAAGSVARSGRRAGRRKALGTIAIALGICALCFVPQLLAQLLRFLLGARLIRREPLAGLMPAMQRVSSVLASCSCCLNPLLYYFHSSSRRWRCPFRLRLRSKKVFTICDRNFGDPSWGYGRVEGKKPRGWNRLIRSRPHVASENC